MRGVRELVCRWDSLIWYGWLAGWWWLMMFPSVWSPMARGEALTDGGDSGTVFGWFDRTKKGEEDGRRPGEYRARSYQRL